MRIGKEIFLTLSILALVSCSKPKVGLITYDGAGQGTELDAMEGCLKGCKVKRVSLANLGKLASYDVLWYHRPDSSAIGELERNAGSAILEYVRGGGHLVLSMDGVHLLNDWNVEPQKIGTWTYDCIDEGFGRKIGYHGYFSHPIFDGLFAGAYPWHGHEDNTVRINGFEGDAMPLADSSEVVGTQWEYIFLRPDKKLIWESKIGKGDILAIGAFLYYGKPNYNEAILGKFTNNVVEYMAGTYDGKEEVKYWPKEKATVKVNPNTHAGGSFVCEAEFEPVNFPRASKRDIPVLPMSLKRDASDNYFDLASPRQMLIASERGGIEEIWSHPFMSLRDYRLILDIEGKDRLVGLSEYNPEFEITPSSAIRRYDIDGIQLVETITLSPDEPVAVIHYEWEGEGINHIMTEAKCNMRMMWPYESDVLGNLNYCWSSEINAFVVRDDSAEHMSIIGANLVPQFNITGQFNGYNYNGYQVDPIVTDDLLVSSFVSYDTKGINAFDVICASGDNSKQELYRQYARALINPASVEESALNYYNNYFEDKLEIITPDSEFNEAFRWAQVSTMQFITQTPGLGRGLMAGYASSGRGWGGGQSISGRPGYAWYFGRDSEWAGFAFDDMGDTEAVRDNLELLIKYQEIDGKIYHELTSSGFAHFDASDATPLMVVLMAHYLKASGDINFVKKNMPAIHKAMDYCYSTDFDGDGLIEINHVGHGWLEGGALYGSQTEFYLCGIWAAALRDAAWLSEVTRSRNKNHNYGEDAQKVLPLLEAFWNEEGYYNYGLKEDDSYTEGLLILSAVPAALDVVDPKRAREMALKFATPEMSADWGSRTITSSCSLGDWGAYGPRNVWPLFTGWASLAEYKAGLYDQGFTSFHQSLLNYKSFSLGRIPEVINGDNYRNNGITQHQCWSESMTIMPLVEGMLGFEPNAVEKKATLAPRLPVEWDSFSAKNLKVGDVMLTLEMRKQGDKAIYEVSSTGPVELTFDIEGSESQTFKLNGTKRIEAALAPTVRVIPPVLRNEPMDEPKGVRLLNQYVQGDTLYVEISGRPMTNTEVELYDNGTISLLPVSFEASDSTYARKTLRINTKTYKNE